MLKAVFVVVIHRVKLSVMRADRVGLRKEDAVAEVLEFYMGKNTPERQNFIVENLIVEDDSQIS